MEDSADSGEVPRRGSTSGDPSDEQRGGAGATDPARGPAVDAGAPGSPQVRRSLVTSTRHRIVTRLRLMRMAPRRARALRELHSGRGPHVDAAGQADTVGPVAGTALVIAHVYYPELWPELADRIRLIPGGVDVAVTLVRGRADQLEGSIAQQLPQATIRVVENCGRDVWPLVQVLDLVPGHDAVLKIHTKRSPHMRKGDAWRAELLDGLCASPEQVAQILRVLREDARIGIVAPPGNVLGREFMGANGPMLASLVTRGGLAYDAARLWFPAGSMFWTHPDILLALGDLGLTAEEFGPESGAIDGTLPHALERYLGVVALARGRVVVESSEVGPLLGAGLRSP